MLASPDLTQICEDIDGEFLHSPADPSSRVEHVIIGAMSSGNVVDEFRPGTLIITPGDREDIILAALSSNCLPSAAEGKRGLRVKGNSADEVDQDGNPCGHPMVVGIILSGNLRPHASILDLIKASNVPVVVSPLDSFTIASSIHSMTVKTLPGDTEKLDKIQSLVEKHVEVDRILEKLRA